MVGRVRARSGHLGLGFGLRVLGLGFRVKGRVLSVWLCGWSVCSHKLFAGSSREPLLSKDSYRVIGLRDLQLQSSFSSRGRKQLFKPKLRSISGKPMASSHQGLIGTALHPALSTNSRSGETRLRLFLHPGCEVLAGKVQQTLEPSTLRLHSKALRTHASETSKQGVS